MPGDSPVCMALEMPDEMSSCSCSNSDHENSRPSRGVRLFGVDLLSSEGMRKSVSLSNLSHYATASSNNIGMQEHLDTTDGYVSDGLVQTNSNARARRKGVPWTEDEHRLFLLGLQKLGKGDWRGISKTFVTTRTPTQVASHAQKYFIRQSNLSKRKRRSSLFDISPGQDLSLPDSALAKNVSLQTSFLELGLGHDRVAIPVAPPLEKIMEEKVFFPSQEGGNPSNGVNFAEDKDDPVATNEEPVPGTGTGAVAAPRGITIDAPAPALWLDLRSQASAMPSEQQQNEALGPLKSNVVKPVASISTGPVRIMEDRELAATGGPSMLSLKLEQPVRHSAFHVSSAFASAGAAAAGLEAPIQCT
ncbi:hypothetical protein SELMODRAFT_445372 [Selaginella moellendorffii]|uniref:Uncharacterized protein n=1 Tax=Selaginella moellendorffii TaxID=88036 RepID=D8SI29_SELML|nr:transcription factor MYBS3 isoform X2 [Selaginella moellendorffii]EFJ15795.1 hypothetical protein SELMODRAFT_445372 [Selaginella moellendorffii]|eukprot:XP_002982986.1 transcription factor MYBS3 isoform X2 [Selaginella moellendorffii]